MRQWLKTHTRLVVNIGCSILVIVAAGVWYGVYNQARSINTPNSGVAVTEEPKVDYSTDGYVIPTPEQLLELANEQRKLKGAAPLTLHSKLNESAQKKADDLARRNYLGHVDPDGKQGYEYIYDGGMTCGRGAENLAMYGYSTDPNKRMPIKRIIANTPFEHPINSWRVSEAHYKVMTSPKYTVTGFGIAIGEDKVHFVEHFCQLNY